MGNLTHTVSGDIASFRSAARVPIESLKCHFKPKQDLHGYSKPWPAGGGKNLFDASQIGSSTSAAYLNLSLDANTTYTFSSNKPSGNGGFSIQTTNTNLEESGVVYENHPITFTTEASGNISIRYYNGSASPLGGYWFQLEKSSSATSYEPYENICPIEGWQGIEAYQNSVYLPNEYQRIIPITFPVLGKNKFNMNLPESDEPLELNHMSIGYMYNYKRNTWLNGKDDFMSNISIQNNIFTYTEDAANAYGIGYCLHLIPEETYCISATTTNGKVNIQFFDKNKQYISTITNLSLNGASFTIPANVYYTFFTFNPISKNQTVTVSDIQLEFGSTSTIYEPYNPNNTVYGGYVDIITGDVINDFNKIIFTGNETIQDRGTSNGIHAFRISRAALTNYSPLGNVYVYMNNFINDGSETVPWSFWVNAATYAIFFYLPSTYTLDSFKQFLSDNTTELIYKCAPEVIGNITPQQLKTLLDQNYIWSNTNDITEVSYQLHDSNMIQTVRHSIAANEPHIETASGAIASFNTDLQAPLKDCKIYFDPIQQGSGDPSPSNVRSINGWTGLTWYQSNKVLVDCESGTINGNTTEEIESSSSLRTKGYFILQPNNTYNFSIISNRPTAQLFRLFSYDASNQQLEYSGPINETSWQVRIGSTYGTQSLKARFTIKNSDSSDFDFNDISNTIVEISKVSDTYQSSIGPTTLDWSSIAGTLYGGYVDLINGKLIQTYKKYKISDFSWTKSSRGSLFIVDINNIDKMNDIMISNTYNTAGFISILTTLEDLSIGGYYYQDNGIYYIRPAIRDDRFTTVDNFIEDMKDVVIVTKLATPIEYQLTPQQLKSLIGTNNIWSNANGSVEIKYWTH